MKITRVPDAEQRQAVEIVAIVEALIEVAEQATLHAAIGMSLLRGADAQRQRIDSLAARVRAVRCSMAPNGLLRWRLGRGLVGLRRRRERPWS